MKNRPVAYSYLRFSTKGQKLGDSKRRQFEDTKKYCVEKGLELSDELFHDEGVSGFRGKNVEEGRLGLFLQYIKEGKVSPGSYLIVESLDRLSRDKVFNALSVFVDIIKGGVKIVTLMDRQVLDETSFATNSSLIFVALSVMIRANEESEAKSERIKKQWINKFENAQNKVVTGKLPAWLELKNGEICVINKRAEIVREIFSKSLNGMGRRTIAKALNERSEPVWGTKKQNPSGLWQDSYIIKILKNRAVIGEYTPALRHQKSSIYPAIKDYFPRVVDDVTFYKVQSVFKSRVGKGGRNASKALNLFSGLTFCSCCGASATLQKKGEKEIYLKCRNSQLAKNRCDAKAISYLSLENGFLSLLENREFYQLLHPDLKRNEIEEKQKILSEQLSSIQETLDYIIDCKANEKTSIYDKKLRDLEGSVKSLKEELKHLENQKFEYIEQDEDIPRKINTERKLLKLQPIRHEFRQFFLSTIVSICVKRTGHHLLSVAVRLQNGKIVMFEKSSKSQNIAKSYVFTDLHFKRSVQRAHIQLRKIESQQFKSGELLPELHVLKKGESPLDLVQMGQDEHIVREKLNILECDSSEVIEDSRIAIRNFERLKECFEATFSIHWKSVENNDPISAVFGSKNESRDPKLFISDAMLFIKTRGFSENFV